MEKKFRKQKRKLAVRISAILLAVWLIVFSAYAVLTLGAEKDRLSSAAQLTFESLRNLIERQSGYPRSLYNDIDLTRKTVRVEKEKVSAAGFMLSTDIVYEYDPNIHIIAINMDDDLKADSDDVIGVSFTYQGEGAEDRTDLSGYLSFADFRASMTDEQYEKIIGYLNAPHDGEYYCELLCTRFYQNERQQILPETVEIVRTRAVNDWYVQDEPVEDFILLPAGAESLPLYEITKMQRNAILNEFVLNTFGSGGLIGELSGENGGVAESSSGMNRTGIFTYIFYCADIIYCEYYKSGYYIYDADDGWTYTWQFDEDVVTAIRSDGVLVLERRDGITAVIPDDDDVSWASSIRASSANIQVQYAERIDLLDACGGELLGGAGAIFLFFLIIGVILTVSLWRVLKTQMMEEQKRREMTNALAHDIKTPLFILSGYAENLMENVQTEKRAHYAGVIVSQADEVNRRVSRMLELSKLDSPHLRLKKSDVNLAGLVKEILENYEVLPDGKSLSFSCVDAENGCIVSADRGLLKRALENLIDNAVKHSSPGTEIAVRVTADAFEISNVCEPLSKDDLGVLMMPFSKADRSRAFSASSSGSGLGLAIVRSIADLHHVKLTCRQKNNTLTFRLTF